MSVAVRLSSVASFLLCTTVWAGGCDGGTAAEVEPVEPVTKKAPPKVEPPPAPEPEPVKPEPVRPNTPKTFEDAVAAAVELYAEHRRTFYCGCAYTPSDRIARGTCGYKTRADESLGKRVAWDRLVPMQDFGAHRQCWREPVCKDEAGQPFRGVSCCEQSDPAFVAMANDLHNIVPAVGELMADRSDFDFEEIEGEARMYGACDFEVSRSLRAAEPSEEIRGDIARAYLYMLETYGDELPLAAERVEVFKAWHKADPADEWEVRRNKKIAGIQGRANSFVPMMVMEPEPAAEEAPPADAPEEAAPAGETADAPAPAARAAEPKPRGAKAASDATDKGEAEAKPADPEPAAEDDAAPKAEADPAPAEAPTADAAPAKEEAAPEAAAEEPATDASKDAADSAAAAKPTPADPFAK